MLIKMTKMALAGALVVGAASAALAWKDGDHQSGGYQAQTRQDIKNARRPKADAAAYGFAPIYVRPNTIPCPTLEGYPDCH